MPGVKCEISINLIWSENYVISSATGQTKFVIADTKLDGLVVTLSTEDNMKLSKQLESGFKRKINWNKYFDYLIDGNFQRIIDFLFYRLKIELIEKNAQNITFQK